MNSAMVFEDPYRAAQHAKLTGMQKNKLFFKDLGKGAWKSGTGFGKVGALYAGSECVIEGVSKLDLSSNVARAWERGLMMSI